MFAYAEMAKHRTSHGLHLLFSIVTLGVWLIFWLAVSVRNADRRNRIAREYGLPAESNIAYKILIIFLILFLVGVYQVYSILFIHTPIEAGESVEPAAQKKQETKWTYLKEEDEMGRGMVQTATIYSLNEIEFSPPNEGKQRAVLILRKNYDNSHDVYFGLQKSRSQCNSRVCGITAQFDNGLTQFFEASPAENDTTPGIYISNADIFIQLTEAANVLTITAGFFREPTQTFQFDISGLSWNY